MMKYAAVANTAITSNANGIPRFALFVIAADIAAALDTEFAISDWRFCQLVVVLFSCPAKPDVADGLAPFASATTVPVPVLPLTLS